MRSVQGRAKSRDDEKPAVGEDAALEPELDELALQIVRRATARDASGAPLESLPVQLQALKVAGAYFALKRKHAPEEADQGAGWGELFLNKPKFSDEDEEEEEEALNG